MTTLKNVISVKMTVKDALKILMVCGKVNGQSDTYYSELSLQLAKLGNIQEAMQKRTFGSIDYYACQSDIEEAFLSPEKSQSQKELDILQQKMDDLQKQINVIKQREGN